MHSKPAEGKAPLPINGDRYLTSQEVKNLTGRSITSLSRDRQLRRGIPFYKFCGAVRYKYKDVESYIRACRVETD
jgi:hypothetical protein